MFVNFIRISHIRGVGSTKKNVKSGANNSNKTIR